jgi:N-acetylmuramoyl-L-alanine amidase
MFEIVNGRLVIAGKAVPFRPTPNQGGRLDPTLVVLHDTAGRLTKGSAVAWLRDPKAKASAHVVIERDGGVTQLVAFDRVAWHAGQSSWRGRSGCNAFSVGIEIVNPGKLTGTPKRATAWFGESFGPEFGIVRARTIAHGDGCWMPYTEDQLRTVEQLIGALAREYPIIDVVAHHDISPGRKVDTTPLMDWPRMRAVLDADAVEQHEETASTGAIPVGSEAGARKHASTATAGNAIHALADLEDSLRIRGWCGDHLGAGYRQDQQRGRAPDVQAVGSVGINLPDAQRSLNPVTSNFQCAPHHSLVAQQRATPDTRIECDGFSACGLAMSAMSHQQSLAQTWKRRQRRQRILVAVVIVVLLAALIYGWLHVFGII